MTKKTYLMFAAVLLFSSGVMKAQGGCADSPEAPTEVLMLVGALGMVKGPAMLQWLRKKSR